MKTDTNQELNVAEQLRHQYYCLSQVNRAIFALEEVVRSLSGTVRLIRAEHRLLDKF